MQKTFQLLLSAITHEVLHVASYDAARSGALTYIEGLFGPDSWQMEYVRSLSNPAQTLSGAYSTAQQSERMKQDLMALAGCLIAMNNAFSEARIARGELVSSDASFDDKKVFVVHGHNSQLREAVSQYLTTEQLTPIVLHERPNQGMTIIEKFIANSDVGFAVVLLTGDDLGHARLGSDENLRARQNVVFELGYFIGHLGRKRIAVLYEENVEKPSDIDGLVYIPASSDHWKDALKLELQAAGVVSLDSSDIAD